MPSIVEVSMGGGGKVLGIWLHTIVIQKFWGGAQVGVRVARHGNKGVMVPTGDSCCSRLCGKC